MLTLWINAYLKREFSAANRTYRLRMKMANDIETVAFMMDRIYLRQIFLKKKYNDSSSRTSIKKNTNKMVDIHDGVIKWKNKRRVSSL